MAKPTFSGKITVDAVDHDYTVRQDSPTVVTLTCYGHSFTISEQHESDWYCTNSRVPTVREGHQTLLETVQQCIRRAHLWYANKQLNNAQLAAWFPPATEE